MREELVTTKLPDYPHLIEIYKNSFPQSEKIPMWLLLIMTKRKCVEFLAFYDENTFCGFTYLIHNDRTTFILYLATDKKVRSKGYGKKILQSISDKYSFNNIVLNIETVDKESDNYEQRLRRQNFYLNNDFKQAGFKIYDKKNIYDVLYKGTSFSKKGLTAFFPKFCTPSILKIPRFNNLNSRISVHIYLNKLD